MKLENNVFGNDAIFRYWFEFGVFTAAVFALVVTGLAIF